MPTLGPLVLVRFLAGAGAAAVIPVAIAWIGDVVPYERRQPVLARFLSGQILGIVFGQAAGGLLGDLIGWRATLVVLGLVHVAAGLLLLRRDAPPRGRPARSDARALARSVASALEHAAAPWVRIVLGSTFLEGMVMFGAFAYVGAELHQRFGLSLGVVGAMLASFGAGALVYSLDRRHAGAALRPARPGGGGRHRCWPPATPSSASCRRPGSRRPPSPSSASASTCCTTRCRPTPRRWRPRRGASPISLFAFALFTGQSVGVALAAPVMDRYGGRPIFLVAAAAILAIAFWFRRQLVRQPA